MDCCTCILLSDEPEIDCEELCDTITEDKILECLGLDDKEEKAFLDYLIEEGKINEYEFDLEDIIPKPSEEDEDWYNDYEPDDEEWKKIEEEWFRELKDELSS